jgi:Lrp/AsnC family transcriptional regulator, leucine-responsive regulatory protein
MANRKIRPERAYEPKGMDALDLRILAELQVDARVSFAELGRRVGLSAPAVADRVQRLEETGVITGYRAAPCRWSEARARLPIRRGLIGSW